jgi:restriction endonuclease S subunit
MNIRTLGDVTKLQKGMTITSKTARSGVVPVIAGGQKPAYFHSEANRPAKSITVSASGAYAGFVAFHSQPIWASDCTTIESIDDKICTPEFLHYFLQSQQDQIYEMQRGSGMPHVYAKDLALLEIWIPPLDVQKRIVETLDEHLSRLDKALAEIQAADLGLKNLQHASLESLFTGGSEPFPTVTMGTLGKWVTGSTPKTSNPLYQGDDVPFVTPGDILYGGEIRSVRRRISNLGADVVRRLPAPSVQVVCIGATLGKVGYSLEEITTNQQITSLLPDDKVITAGYAAWLLSSPSVQSLLWNFSSSTTVPILNKGALERIEVPLVPLEKQSEILAQIDAQTELSLSLLERTRLARENISSLRRAILNRAFSGKLLEVKA